MTKHLRDRGEEIRSVKVSRPQVFFTKHIAAWATPVPLIMLQYMSFQKGNLLLDKINFIRQAYMIWFNSLKYYNFKKKQNKEQDPHLSKSVEPD